MALHDEILVDIVSGLIPSPFRVADLLSRPDPVKTGYYLVGCGSYSENALKVIPANHSETRDGTVQGDYVKKGRPAAFYRLGNGQYELIAGITHEVHLNQEQELLGDNEGEDESLFADVNADHEGPPAAAPNAEAGLEDPLDPVEIIVETLARIPYRTYFRRQRIDYPDPPAVGWEARLASYFWPRLSQGWEVTRQAFDNFYGQFQTLETTWDPDSNTTQAGLLPMFSEICIWGNVKLPEGDPVRLAREVDEALTRIDAGEIPENCRLNSAWTKLYAVTRPETFVIYDSRVATALVSLLDPYMTRLADTPAFEPYSGLGTVAGRGGTRPRPLEWDWGNGYQSWQAQYSANRLCQAVVQRLNDSYPKSSSESPWTLREVEAVLFMEGY